MTWRAPATLLPLDSWNPSTTHSVADRVAIACLLEASAPKLGNVHPNAPFPDMTYADFVRSAEAIHPIFNLPIASCGDLIEQAVIATQRAVGRNTNLGILLLLGPLAFANLPRSLASSTPHTPSPIPSHNRLTFPSLQSTLQQTISHLTAYDAAAIYRAIRVAHPGGLGQQTQLDIHASPPLHILEAMQYAQSYDQIAAEYCQGFPRSLQIAGALVPRYRAGEGWLSAIAFVHLEHLAREPDSLIQRKHGPTIAQDVVERAKLLLAQLKTAECPTQHPDWLAFDRYLRGNNPTQLRLNPGTTADLMAAGLFLASQLADWDLPST